MHLTCAHMIYVRVYLSHSSACVWEGGRVGRGFEGGPQGDAGVDGRGRKGWWRRLAIRPLLALLFSSCLSFFKILFTDSIISPSAGLSLTWITVVKESTLKGWAPASSSHSGEIRQLYTVWIRAKSVFIPPGRYVYLFCQVLWFLRLCEVVPLLWRQH